MHVLILVAFAFTGCLAAPGFDGVSVDGGVDASVRTDMRSDTGTPSDVPVEWADRQFSQRVVVTVDAGASIDDVPVYIEFVTPFERAIRVYGSNGMPWPYELMDGQRRLWVRAPRLGRNTQFYIYFDPSIAAATVPESIWTDYHYVFHMDDDAQNVGPTRREETDTIAQYASEAPFGKAAVLRDGTNISMPSFDEGFVRPDEILTLDLWIKPVDLDSSNRRFVVYMRSQNNGPSIQYDDDEPTTLIVEHEVDDTDVEIPIPNQVFNQWVYVGVVYDRVNNQMRVYRNGILVDTQDMPSEDIMPPPNTFRIGSNNVGHDFTGMVDEVRAYNGSRPQAWFNFQYRMGTDPDLIVVGIPETIPD